MSVYPRYVPLARVDTVFIAALIFVGLDGITTTAALITLPAASEANPLIAAAIHSVGLLPAMSLKVLIGALLASFLSYSADRGYPFAFMQRNWRLKRVPRQQTCVRAYRMLIVLAVLHGLVVINNIIVIYIHSGGTS